MADVKSTIHHEDTYKGPKPRRSRQYEDREKGSDASEQVGSSFGSWKKKLTSFLSGQEEQERTTSMGGDTYDATKEKINQVIDVTKSGVGESNQAIENQEGLVNFDEILRESDAFMVARGDLGMEIPVEKIFLAQKMMIYKCNAVGKPIVTATQMLESMIKSPRPTRAEATDVANAVLDGTDAVMLSGESAAGAYPELAVKTMARICLEAESSLDYDAIFKEIMKSAPLPMSPLESLASSAVRTANKVRASLIVVLTRGGSTANLVAKYRPSVPILSVAVPVMTTDSLTWSCSEESPARQSLMYRGMVPMLAEGSAKATDTESTDAILTAALQTAVRKKLCKSGDAVVALHRIGIASVIKIMEVK